MKTMTKMFALGGVGLLGAAAAVAAVRAKRRAAAKQQAIDAFDFADLDEPVIVTEEVLIVTEPDPFDVETQRATGSDFEMPGRGAGPR